MSSQNDEAVDEAVGAPLTGDPVAVRRSAQRYAAVAASIAVAAQALREIAAQRHERSEAVAAVANKADEVADQVSRARGRYVTVGRALGAYAVRLDAARGSADAAIRAGRVAHAEMVEAAARVQAARADLQAATPADLPARTSALAAAESDEATARRRYEAARHDHGQAVVARDAAALEAVDQIRGALHDGLDDGWWQDWGKAVLTTVAAVADVVANACGLLALAFCWVPGLGEVFALAALLAAAVKLAADVVLASTGDDVTWADVIWDGVGLIPGGLGKGAGTMARTTTRAAAGTARREAGRIASKAPGLRPPGVLGEGVSSPDVMHRLLGDSWTGMSRREAIDAMGGASGRRAFADMLDPRVELRAVKDTRGIRRTKPLREWWADSRGATFAVRMLGDPELAKDLYAVKSISPVLLAASHQMATAVRTARTWRRVAAGAYGLTAVDAVAGPQDLADWAFGDADYAPGSYHAIQSLWNIHQDGDARRVLHLGPVKA